MPASCCIKMCRNKKKDGVSLFRFPFKREDHLKKWLQNIGDSNFEPKKFDVICSAHFQQKDFMSIRGASSILLNYSAVPSIFPYIPENKSVPISTALENSIVNCSSTQHTSAVSKNLDVNLPSTSTINPFNFPTMDTCSTFNMDTLQTTEKASDVPLLKTDLRKNKVHQIFTRSLLKINQHSSVALISDVQSVENTSMNISDTTEHSKVKKRRIMHSSTLHFKNQEISPRERKMQREIKTLREKLRRRDKKILSLQNLLK